MLLKDKVAIISGIGPGLGQALALAFAREGAAVALAARGAAKLAELADVIRGNGGRVVAVPTDISSTESCRALVDATTAALGPVDVLVNNAYHPGTYEPIESTDLDATWKPPFEVNVLGSLRLAQAVVPGMKARGRGAVVMINSMSMRRMMPTFGGYAASKAALNAATQTLAQELGPHGIRVNSVVPGYIWGPPLEAYFAAEAAKAGVEPRVIYDAVASETALRHIPTSEEVADAAVFLASDMARAMTGASVDVNGGHWFW